MDYHVGAGIGMLERLLDGIADLVRVPQLHLALDPDMKLRDAHQISDAVEKALQNAYPGADVIIHQDPAGLEPVPPDFS